MFVRAKKRFKDGKEHHCYRNVPIKRVRAQRHGGICWGRPAEVVGGHTLYRCLDKLVRTRAFFSFLKERWETLFDARFDVLLYDLSSTYFESDPPFSGQARFWLQPGQAAGLRAGGDRPDRHPAGVSAGLRGDAGQPSEPTTLAGFLEKIEAQYGRSERVWIMDRGIPTEATLSAMRASDPPRALPGRARPRGG